MKTPTGIQKNKNVNFYQPITLRKHYFCKNNRYFKELTSSSQSLYNGKFKKQTNLFGIIWNQKLFICLHNYFSKIYLTSYLGVYVSVCLSV